MKVVVDTNVVISAALKDRDPEKVIMFIIGTADFQWFASAEILAEYLNVLERPKFALPAEIITRWRERLMSTIKLIDLTPTVNFPRDPKDAKFLACALAVDAKYLLTGDKDLSIAQKISSTTILSVAQFKSLVCDKWK
jgi:uncharacterized protein